MSQIIQNYYEHKLNLRSAQIKIGNGGGSGPVGELILEVEDDGGGLRRMKGWSSRGTSGRLAVSASVLDGDNVGADRSASLTISLLEIQISLHPENQKRIIHYLIFKFLKCSTLLKRRKIVMLLNDRKLTLYH
jgi:hypothetical protein